MKNGYLRKVLTIVPSVRFYMRHCTTVPSKYMQRFMKMSYNFKELYGKQSILMMYAYMYMHAFKMKNTTMVELECY